MGRCLHEPRIQSCPRHSCRYRTRRVLCPCPWLMPLSGPTLGARAVGNSHPLKTGGAWRCERRMRWEIRRRHLPRSCDALCSRPRRTRRAERSATARERTQRVRDLPSASYSPNKGPRVIPGIHEKDDGPTPLSHHHRRHHDYVTPALLVIVPCEFPCFFFLLFEKSYV